MKSVLYIGPYRQNDQWGYNAKALATLLSAQNINLVLRPIWFTEQEGDKDVEKLEQYEQNTLESRDVLIQHGLPSYINYNGDFETNIAVISLDSRIGNTDWVDHLNLMDKVVVFSRGEAILLIESGVCSEKVTYFTSPPFLLVGKKQAIDIGKIQGPVFYTSGSLDKKCGLIEVLTAFLATFSYGEASLVVCTDDPEGVKEAIEKIREGLGIFAREQYYPNVILINNTSREVMEFIHSIGDFFIDVGYNYSINQSTLSAIVNGSIPIVPENADLSFAAFQVKTYEEVCFYPNRPLQDLWSGASYWTKPSTFSLKEAFQDAVSKDLDFTKQAASAFKENIFSAPNNDIKEILCIQ